MLTISEYQTLYDLSTKHSLKELLTRYYLGFLPSEKYAVDILLRESINRAFNAPCQYKYSRIYYSQHKHQICNTQTRQSVRYYTV